MQRDDGDQYDAKECFDYVFCSDHCPALQEVFQCVTLPGELRPHSHRCAAAAKHTCNVRKSATGAQYNSFRSHQRVAPPKE